MNTAPPEGANDSPRETKDELILATIHDAPPESPETLASVDQLSEVNQGSERIRPLAAAVRESEAPIMAKRVRMQFMSVGPGNTAHRHYYTEEAVKALVPLIKRQPKMYLDHPIDSEVKARGHRSLRDLAAVVVPSTVRYDPHTRAAVGEVVLHPQVAPYMEMVREADSQLGASVNGYAEFGPLNKEGWKPWKRWMTFDSVDIVPVGGARGYTMDDVREAAGPVDLEAETRFYMDALTEMTPEQVREAAPDLVDAIVRTFGSGHAPTAFDPARIEEIVRESAAYQEIEQRLGVVELERDELKAERNRQLVAAHVIDLVRECGVESEPAIKLIAAQFTGATLGPKGTYSDQETLDARVRESAQHMLDVLAEAGKGSPPSQSGAIVGQGARPTNIAPFVAPSKDGSNVAKAFDLMFQ